MRIDVTWMPLCIDCKHADLSLKPQSCINRQLADLNPEPKTLHQLHASPQHLVHRYGRAISQMLMALDHHNLEVRLSALDGLKNTATSDNTRVLAALVKLMADWCVPVAQVCKCAAMCTDICFRIRLCGHCRVVTRRRVVVVRA